MEIRRAAETPAQQNEYAWPSPLRALRAICDHELMPDSIRSKAASTSRVPAKVSSMVMGIWPPKVAFGCVNQQTAAVSRKSFSRCRTSMARARTVATRTTRSESDGVSRFPNAELGVSGSSIIDRQTIAIGPNMELFGETLYQNGFSSM